MVTNFIEKLHTLLHDAITAIGYEFWGMEFIPQHRGALVRVYIDHPAGITIADCVAATHQIKGMLQVAETSDDDFLSDASVAPPQNDAEKQILTKLGRYELEVSSPGIDRPLFELKHFAKFINSKVYIKLKEATELCMENGKAEPRKQLTGIIMAVDDSLISIKDGEVAYTIDYKQIKKAHLVM